jgi:hypothetical protein
MGCGGVGVSGLKELPQTDLPNLPAQLYLNLIIPNHN